MAKISDYVKARLDAPSEEQRNRLSKQNVFLRLSWLTDRQFADLAEFELPR